VDTTFDFGTSISSIEVNINYKLAPKQQYQGGGEMRRYGTVFNPYNTHMPWERGKWQRMSTRSPTLKAKSHCRHVGFKLLSDLTRQCLALREGRLKFTWHQIEGRGIAIPISTCFPLTSASNAISMFIGSKHHLCMFGGVAGYTCKDSSVLSRWENIIYYILVQPPYGIGAILD
jgi:hypothetical protein